MAGLMATGTVVEGTLFALWPLAAWNIAGLARSVMAPDATPHSELIRLAWTPTLIAPLLLAGVLAFPLLGPLLHILLLAGVGVGLAGPLAEASGLGRWTAFGCIALAGFGLAATVEIVRRLIVRVIAGAREPETVV
jgi:hypothetical protein